MKDRPIEFNQSLSNSYHQLHHSSTLSLNHDIGKYERLIQRQSIRLTHRTKSNKISIAIKLFRTKDLFDADQLSNKTEQNFFFYELDARTKSNQIELFTSNKSIYGECFHYSAFVYNNAFGCFYALIINANQLRNNRRTYFTLLIYFLRHFLTYV